MDQSAIYIGSGSWPYYTPKAIFVGDKWLIVSNQGGMIEWVGVQRLTVYGTVLDALPVNICYSIGAASLEWPSIATNGDEILCVTGAAGSGLYGSIFDYDLNIIKDRFLVYENSEGILKLSANGNNFFLTFTDAGIIKLAIISNTGQILSVQDVSQDDPKNLHATRYFPSIYVHEDISYSTYLELQYYLEREDVLTRLVYFTRRYSMSGIPIDQTPILMSEIKGFKNYLLNTWVGGDAFLDITCINECMYFFLPEYSQPGISMFSYISDLSKAYQPISLNSQCQLQVEFNILAYHTSLSFIRSSSIGNKVLTAWIDGRDENSRVYANLFEITEKK